MTLQLFPCQLHKFHSFLNAIFANFVSVRCAEIKVIYQETCILLISKWWYPQKYSYLNFIRLNKDFPVYLVHLPL